MLIYSFGISSIEKTRRTQVKKKIAIGVLSLGCLALPACLDTGVFGFGVSGAGLEVCFPGKGILNVCADVSTPFDFDDLSGGEE